MDGQAVPDMAALEAIKANYALTDEQRQIVDHVERVSREVLHPLQEKMDADEWWPDDLFRQMGELGLLGITAPEELGGSGQNEFTQALVSEVISKWNPAVGLSHGAHDNLCLNNILRNGSEQQLRKYVPGLCKGELVGALGLTEPGAGSDALGSMATTAARDGDNYIINGTKIYITNGPIADVILLYAKTDKAKGAKGISAFIVETDNPGFKVAQKLDKMGFRGSPTGELVFEDCRVPVSAMVGVENAGVSVVMSGLDLERAMVATLCVGMAERALELALEYAKIREQFGKPIGSFQMVQSMLAEIYTEVETARAFSYRALAACAGLPKGAGGRGEIHKLTAAACLYAGEAFNKAVTGPATSMVARDICRIRRSTACSGPTSFSRSVREPARYARSSSQKNCCAAREDEDMNPHLLNAFHLPTHFMTEEQQALADQASKFFFSEFHHLNAEMDDADDLPVSVFPKLGKMGYLGLNVSPEFGGAGLDFTSACIITEELSRASAAIGLSHLAHDNLCANNIYRNANEELRRKYLTGLCKGELIGALGLTEPGAGSDALGSMRTTAKKDGNDYIVNGAKIYITNGPIADIVLVYAKTSPEKGAKGISAFIIESDTPGFKVAQKLNKMGFRGSPTGELVFEDCRVPAKNLVGKLDGGVAVTMSGLDLERAIVCFNAIGIARRALEISIDYAKTREQFGKRIASFQMVQAMLAEMYTQVEAARSLSLRTAAACEGLEEGAGGRGEIHKLTAAAIFKASAATSFVLDRAVQIHGGSGYMRDTEVNRLYRTGRVLEVGAGTQEVRKLIISGELLKN